MSIMSINTDLKDIAYFPLGHWMVKYMDWIYSPALWHGKHLTFQSFSRPTCKLQRISALTHHSPVTRIQCNRIFKHLTQCLVLRELINKYQLLLFLPSRFLLSSHLNGEQPAVRVVRFRPQAGSAPRAMKLLLLPFLESLSYILGLQLICRVVCYHFLK